MADKKPVNKEQDTTLGVVTHLLTLVSSFIAPLIILLVAKDAFSRNNARAALNWQISLFIYMLISVVLISVVLISVVLMLLPIGFFLMFVLGIINIIFIILAAVKASEGEVYSYPMTIPFLKFE